MSPAVPNLFAPKSSRVVRALLVNAGRKWSEREIAKTTGVSTGTAHYVCTRLLEFRYLARDENNRITLIDPLRLLNRWAAYHQFDIANSFLQYHTFEREIEKVTQEIARIDLEYAATVLTGAWLVAPYVRPVDLYFYSRDEDTARRIATKMELRPIPKGGNIRFVIPYDQGVFYGSQILKGVKVVSNVQLYVDLYNFSARGEEAASRLLQVILEEWQARRRSSQHV